MSDATSLKLSEIFASIQGEGPSAGEPASFLRLATCNLHCSFCDTKYTWDWQAYRYEDEVSLVDVLDVAAHVRALEPRRLVVTGGEPLLQQAALSLVLSGLAEWTIEVETNGTLVPSSELTARVDQWNVSPKLANGGDPESIRIRRNALDALRATDRAFLKLVIADESDLSEADRLVAELGWPSERVLFMPEAQDRQTLRARSGFVAEAALRRGHGFSPRLHVELWDGERGR